MLLIDLGNTRFKAAFADDLDRTWVVVRDGQDVSTAVAELLDCCYRMPNQLVVSCVGDQASAAEVITQGKALWGLTAERLVAGESFGALINGYAIPQSLGIDRWAAIVAAWHRVKGAVVVVDCGTAVTVDTIETGGQHLGGVIFPGLQLSADSFYRQTHNVVGATGEVRRPFADNTADAVNSGVRWAVAGGINEVLNAIFSRFQSEVPVLLTGGDAAELQPLIHAQTQQVDNLVFQGMALMGGFEQGTQT